MLELFEFLLDEHLIQEGSLRDDDCIDVPF